MVAEFMKRIYRVPFGLVLCASVLLGAAVASAQTPGRVVEEIVARVNNDIITRGDLEQAKETLRDEIGRDCPRCAPAEIEERYAAAEKNLLRDLIDNLLLIQRAKDLGVNVDTDVVRRMDQIRQENKIESMEELEKQVRAAGLDYEEFRTNIRNELYRQEIMRREVGARIQMDPAEVKKYYDEHMEEFVRPEQVYVREIFVSTEGKTDAEKVTLKAKADGLLQRVRSGEDFGGLARVFSDGSTAANGGELGLFGKGQMPANLEQATFQLNRNEVTDVIEVQGGYLILQVMEHYVAGQQPLDKVENEIMNKMYNEKMRPALREYLDQQREESFVEVRAGFTDTSGAVSRPIGEAPAAPASETSGGSGSR
jgi:peptidyl-prolyl cis-trans isomerase SurA